MNLAGQIAGRGDHAGDLAVSDRPTGADHIIPARHGDAAHMAIFILEWTGTVLPAPAPETGKAAEEAKPTAEATTEAKPKAKRAAKKPAAEKTDAK